MSATNQSPRRAFWLILSLLSAFSMWYYVANVWSIGQSARFSDLYAPWWGAHELLLHGRDPYSPGVTRETQTVIYGAPVATSRPGDAAELAGGFAYPIYVVFLLWPTVYEAFPAIERAFVFLFVALTLASLWLWLSALKWRLPAADLGIVAVFMFGSFPVLQGLKLENLSLLAAFLVAAALASLAAEQFTIAGLLLAAATIKPQFVILLIPWLAVWTMGDWQRRRGLAWSFSAAMSALILGGEVLAPGWVRRFLTIVRAYQQYTYGHSLLDVWFSSRIAPVVAAVLVLVLLLRCWQGRSHPAHSSAFFLVSSWVLAATLIVIPTLEPHAQLLLLPGFLFLLRYGSRICRLGKIPRIFLTSAWLLLGWAWIVSVGMMLATIWIPAETLRRFWELPLYTSPLIPFGIFVVLGYLLTKKTEFPPLAV